MASETGKRIAVGHKRLRTAPLKFNGMDVVFDPDMPADEVRIVDHTGKILARTKPIPHQENT